jgi:hypothetical protein
MESKGKGKGSISLMFAELLLLFPSVSFAPHFRQKKIV